MISVLDLPPVGVFLQLCLSRPSVRERFKIRCEPFFFRPPHARERGSRQAARRRRRGRRGRQHSMPDQPQEDVTSFKARTHHGSGKKETYELKVRGATKKQLVGEAAEAVPTRSKSLVCLSNSLIWCCDINRTVRPPGSCCCDLCRSVPREEQARQSRSCEKCRGFAAGLDCQSARPTSGVDVQQR